MVISREQQHVPQAVFHFINGGGELQVLSSAELFSHKTSVLLSLSGAFTPTCSNLHLPRYNEQ